MARGSAQGAMVDAATTTTPGTATVTQTVTVPNPKVWSLTSPALYSVVTTVVVGGAVVDTYTTSFGIRTFAFDANNGFTLNGESVKLNGTCNHNDLGALGAAVNYRAIEKRLQMLKDMGVNALRTSHNPPAPEFLDIADRLGLLVMDEAFDCWDQGKNTYDYGRFFNQWGTTDIGAMVMRDRNHPSIVIWSIGNEIPDDNNATVAQSLISAVKAKDITRVIGQAFAEASPGAAVAPLEDVVGLNYAPYVYDSLHSSHPTWRFFASESSSAVRSRGIRRVAGHVEHSDVQHKPVLLLRQQRGLLGHQRRGLVAGHQHEKLHRRRVHLDGLRLHRRAHAVRLALQEFLFRRD